MSVREVTIDNLRQLAGQELGASEWVTVSQERVLQFAEATGDRQWIHCDPQRAACESPYGGTVAHGYLTLSLGPALLGISSRSGACGWW